MRRPGLPAVEVRGIVDDQPQVEQKHPPIPAWSRPDGRAIPVLKFRLALPSDSFAQVYYQGETQGTVHLHDEVTVRGAERAGVLHAEYIFNHNHELICYRRWMQSVLHRHGSVRFVNGRSGYHSEAIPRRGAFRISGGTGSRSRLLPACPVRCECGGPECCSPSIAEGVCFRTTAERSRERCLC